MQFWAILRCRFPHRLFLLSSSILIGWGVLIPKSPVATATRQKVKTRIGLLSLMIIWSSACAWLLIIKSRHIFFSSAKTKVKWLTKLIWINNRCIFILVVSFCVKRVLHLGGVDGLPRAAPSLNNFAYP